MGYSTVAQPFESFNDINSIIIRIFSGDRIVLQIIWRYCPQCYALRVFVYIVLFVLLLKDCFEYINE